MRYVLVLWLLLLSLQSVSAQENEALLTLGHGGIVTSAAWNTDETRILTAGDDGMVRIWDAVTGEPVLTLDAGGPVVGATWSVDSSRILAWTSNGYMSLWDDQGALIDRFETITRVAINQAVWNADETQVVIAADDGNVYLWMQETPTVATIPHESPVLQAEFGDDAILTFEQSGIAHIFSLASLEEIRALSFDQDTLGIDWALESDQVLTWGGSGAAMVWNIADGQKVVRRTLDHSRTFVNGARWSTDTNQVISWGADETVRLWDVAIGDNTFTGRHRDWVTGATFSEAERLVLSWSFNEARLWQIGNRSSIARFTHENLVTGAAFNDDATQVLTWGWDGMVYVWDIEAF